MCYDKYKTKIIITICKISMSCLASTRTRERFNYIIKHIFSVLVDTITMGSHAPISLKNETVEQKSYFVGAFVSQNLG